MDPQALVAAKEIDFSLIALFLRATFMVKLVMLGLMAMSFWSWAIIVRKHLMFRQARTEAAVFDHAFWSGEPLDELYEKIGADPQGASEKIFAAGMLAVMGPYRPCRLSMSRIWLEASFISCTLSSRLPVLKS